MDKSHTASLVSILPIIQNWHRNNIRLYSSRWYIAQQCHYRRIQYGYDIRIFGASDRHYNLQKRDALAEVNQYLELSGTNSNSFHYIPFHYLNVCSADVR